MKSPPFTGGFCFPRMSKEIITRLLDKNRIERSLVRIAHEIIEHHPQTENLALIGIRTRGEFIANRLRKNLKVITGNNVPVGLLDVTFYRDDFRERLIQPQVKSTDISFSIDELVLILADDVLYTGRTIRAALDEIMDFGRPASVSVAVLIDRGHREMPIRADFVGKNIPTAENEHVHVRLKEVDDEDQTPCPGRRRRQQRQRRDRNRSRRWTMKIRTHVQAGGTDSDGGSEEGGAGQGGGP